ncbi:kinase-like protein [Leucogyrophana mollusca]|uniref:Kinase-like protein n=1 Tax=Leucogyrophana mollusca TaxID=85980 RepID=A0ACB8BXT7_9AGAM|nr:kinase-like protein [Leucogyrophana mollusca]
MFPCNYCGRRDLPFGPQFQAHYQECSSRHTRANSYGGGAHGHVDHYRGPPPPAQGDHIYPIHKDAPTHPTSETSFSRFLRDRGGARPPSPRESPDHISGSLLRSNGEIVIQRIHNSPELLGPDKNTCETYVRCVWVYKNLLAYTFAHLKRCVKDSRSSLSVLHDYVEEWKRWNAFKFLVTAEEVKMTLLGLLKQGFEHLPSCRSHLTIKLNSNEMAAEDLESLGALAIYAGRKHETEFFSLRGGAAQDMVNLLEDCLGDVKLDPSSPCRRRLMSNLVRLSRKAACFPQQLTIVVPEKNPLEIDTTAKGLGGSADIFKGRYKGRAVAVKFLRRGANSPASEAVVWRHLSHENILPFFGILEMGTGINISFALVAPFMDNGNVREFLARNPEEDRVRLAQGVTEGLRFLHSQEPPIVHGDLKGDNILVDKHKHACISDFGISSTEDSRQILDSSNVGRSKSQVRWIAPEILSSAEGARFTSMSDVYAYASVLYEIFSSQFPFHQYNEQRVAGAILRGEKPVRPQMTDVDADYWDFLDVCWSRRREDRPTAKDASDYFRWRERHSPRGLINRMLRR